MACFKAHPAPAAPLFSDIPSPSLHARTSPPSLQGTKVNSKGKEVPLATRLYSIASTRYGDHFDGNTASLCVRRATYWCPELQAEDPVKKGVCSNFLCDAEPGTEITMTGASPGWLF